MREVIKCPHEHCRLNQFVTSDGNCRRCRKALVLMPEPVRALPTCVIDNLAFPISAQDRKAPTYIAPTLDFPEVQLWDLVAAGMTPRERDVAHELLVGRDNKQIANALGLAHSSIKGYLGRLFAKFDITPELNQRVALANRLLAYSTHG